MPFVGFLSMLPSVVTQVVLVPIVFREVEQFTLGTWRLDLNKHI